MTVNPYVAAVAVFFIAVASDGLWVILVRAVKHDAITLSVAVGVVMSMLGNLALFSMVDERWLMVPDAAGAAAGVAIGIRFGKKDEIERRLSSIEERVRRLEG